MLGLTRIKTQRPRVLVVDDDPLFDGLVVDHLSENNEYQVHSARSGEQALRILEQSDIDVLITDIKMPNKDGFELVTQVRRDHPTMSVIVVTAFGKPRLFDREDDTVGIVFLEKPVNFSRLKKALRKAVYDSVPVPESPASNEEKVDASMLAGQVAQFPVLDMIQICCIAERTGCITLQRGALTSRIYIESGEIVHAECGPLTGSEAFLELATWDDADFSFQNAVPPPKRSILKAWESLVYECIQRRSLKKAA